MKVILEFTDEERSQAEDAFRGTEYKIALITLRENIRRSIKWKEMSTEEHKAWEEINKIFYEITADLSLE